MKRTNGENLEDDACNSYDAMQTIGHAFTKALTSGLSYDNPDTFNKVIRESRFTGCSGFVSFDKRTNDRNIKAFSFG
jgi:hypothetical protein